MKFYFILLWYFEFSLSLKCHRCPIEGKYILREPYPACFINSSDTGYVQNCDPWLKKCATEIILLDRSKKLFGFRRGCTYDNRYFSSIHGCNSMVRKSAAKCNCEGDFCNVHQLNNEIFRQILYGGNSRSNGGTPTVTRTFNGFTFICLHFL
eukprot:12141.XXX_417717_416249_1 [CDS] Oithona nana genome sequencing.